MISGWVDGDHGPVVPLRLVADSGIGYRVECLVDTGNDGQLVLPSELVTLLDLVPTGEIRDVIVAGGEKQGWPVYRANVYWNGQLRDVEVLESDTPPLLGMAMIYDPEGGHTDRLTIDTAAGSVLIEHNSPASLT